MSDEADDRISRETEDVRLQIAHAQAQLYDRAKRKRDARRQYARDYYARHRDEQREYQRQARAKQRAQDPDAYRERVRARNKRWRDKHREQANAHQREKYHADPEKRRRRRREAYARNPEEQRARRRAYYAANKEKSLAAQQRWRDREKRRVEAGLPVRRLHRVSSKSVLRTARLLMGSSTGSGRKLSLPSRCARLPHRPNSSPRGSENPFEFVPRTTSPFRRRSSSVSTRHSLARAPVRNRIHS
jgi:hypothetical protein